VLIVEFWVASARHALCEKDFELAMLNSSSIVDVTSYRGWLASVNEQDRFKVGMVLASRTALRILPYVSAYSGQGTFFFHKQLKFALWGNLIARCAKSWPDTDLQMAIAVALGDFPISPYKSSASQILFEKQKLAIDIARSVVPFSLTDKVVTDRAVEIAIGSDNPVRSDMLVSLRRDALLVSQSVNADEMQSYDLWPQGPTDWWKDSIFDWIIQFGDLKRDWNVWLQWYDAIALGKPVFGLKDRKSADALERAIALGGKDGKFHEEFWEREPAEINAEIAEWVAEARAAEALQVGQGSGLRFQYRNGLIELGKSLGLAAPKDDRKRIDANLPKLAELADLLKAALDAREAPYPHLLLKTLDRFTTLVNSKPQDIEPDHLHAATVLLRGQIESAARPSATSNAPPLEDGELALAKSITLISDLVVLGTARGKLLFDDADRAATDAGPDEKFRSLTQELFELIKTDGGIMDTAAVDLLLEILVSGNLASHPKRFAYLQEGSVKNALMVFGGVALVGLIASTSFGLGLLGYTAGKLIDVGIDYKLSHEAKSKIDEFIGKYRNKLVAIAKEKESLKWLNDVLYLVEQHRKRKDDEHQ
jgi:hypothetical protein